MARSGPGRRKRAPRRLGEYLFLVFDLMNTLLWGKRGHRAHLAQFYRIAFDIPRSVTNQRILDVVDQCSTAFASRNQDWTPELRITLLNAAIGQVLNPAAFGHLHPRSDDLLHRGQRVMQMYQTVGHNGGADPWVLRREVLKMLRTLQAAGIPMALGTNQRAVNVHGALEHHQLGQFFSTDCVFISEELGIWKPQTGFIDTIAELVQMNVEDMVYVGNSPTKDAPLARAGCQVILLDHDGRYRVELTGTQFREANHEALESDRLLLTTSVTEVTQLLLQAYSR